MRSYYDTLGISRSASEAEIKKAYKKLAMQYHPDRNKGDKKAEEHFKEINEAYQILGDSQKKKKYDQFGSIDGNPFEGMNTTRQSSQRAGYRNPSGEAQFTGFGDIFSQFSGIHGDTNGFEFDLGDLFGKKQETSKAKRQKENLSDMSLPNVDILETVEIPFLDFLKDTSVSVTTVYGKTLSLKVKAGTKPGTKYKISGKGRTIEGRTGDMYVVVDAKMPQFPLDPSIEKMIEAIRYQI